jgi:hypothetical protein
MEKYLARETIENEFLRNRTVSDTISVKVSTHRTVWHVRKPDPAGPGDARVLDGELRAFAVSPEKRVGSIQAGVFQCAPQPGGVLGVPGNSVHQIRVGDTPHHPKGAPKGGASLPPAFVEEVQQPQKRAQSNGRAGKQARQL